MSGQAEAFVLGKLREVTGNPEILRGASTEVYYDTRVSGSDLDELVSSLSDHFGTDFSEINVGKYAPHEGAEIFRRLLMMLGRRPYQSLTVEMLVAAIQRGRWL